MKVILRENVNKLGRIGDIVNSKDGFARNFLIPKGLAVEATTANIKANELLKKSKEASREKENTEARELAKKLQDASFTMSVEANSEDKLYGAITSGDIAALLQLEGYKIDKDDIVVGEPIKALGIYQVDIKFNSDVSAKIKIWVVRK